MSLFVGLFNPGMVHLVWAERVSCGWAVTPSCTASWTCTTIKVTSTRWGECVHSSSPSANCRPVHSPRVSGLIRWNHNAIIFNGSGTWILIRSKFSLMARRVFFLTTRIPVITMYNAENLIICHGLCRIHVNTRSKCPVENQIIKVWTRCCSRVLFQCCLEF